MVVGVDGSEASSLALAWAADEARLRKADLKVIHAWQVPAFAYGADDLALPVDTGDWRSSAVSSLHEQVRSVLGDHDLGVSCAVEEGQAAHVLVEQSRHAELLVVGSRGHGGFVGLLLGSVSSSVAHHAACPVVIVRS